MQIHIHESGRADPTLRCPMVGTLTAPLFPHACGQKRVNEPEKARVLHPFPEQFQEDRVMHSIEARFDVTLSNPMPAATGMVEKVHRLSQSLMGRAAWSKAVREGVKHPFVQRF
jgi:hypothetical protein